MQAQLTLTLNLPEAAHALFTRHPLLQKAIRRQGESFVSIYYDSRRSTLLKQNVTLHLRKLGTGWLQVVRRNTGSWAGLIPMLEWKTPYLNTLDFSTIDDVGVRQLLEKAKAAHHLFALFETNYRRVTWQLQPASDVVLLVMLDRGWIAADGRRATITEVKIELIKGSTTHLCEIAYELAKRIELTPELVSKAERGYRLALNMRPVPARATAVFLAAGDHPLDAFSAIALNCLSHLHQNHAGAVIGDDPEYVHQMRVATRRLRAALRMFAPVLPEGFCEQIIPPLRSLMDVLGRTRDVDVLQAEIINPVSVAIPYDPRISALASVMAGRRHAARKETGDFLTQPDYSKLILLVALLLNGGALAEKVQLMETDSADTLISFAQRRLHKLQRRTHQLAELARIDDPQSLHALRIAIKRFRYGLEFFGPLMPKRSYAAAAKQLAALQDNLGQINDLTTAGLVLMACAGDDPNLREAVALIGGWHGPRQVALLGVVPKQLQVVRKMRLPKIN